MDMQLSRLPLYCHIGIPKTGTSSLQQALTSNSEALKSKGFDYPKIGFFGDKGTAQHFVSFALTGEKPNWVGGDVPSRDVLRKQFSARSLRNKNLIISSESFSSPNVAANCSKLHDIFPDRDIRIVAFVRRPGDHQNSWYGQIVKDYPFVTMPFEQFVANNQFPFFQSFQAYSEVFGSDKIHVINYDQARTTDGVVGAFLKVIGLNNLEIELPEDENVSPTSWHIELCRRLNHIGQDVLPTNVRRLFYETTFGFHPQSVADATFATDWKSKIFPKLNAVGHGVIDDNLRRQLYAAVLQFCEEMHEAAEFKNESFVEAINKSHDMELNNWLTKRREPQI